MSDQDQFDDEFEGVDEFDSDADFQGGQSLKELWRKNPLFKFGTIGVGLVVIIISVNLFGSNDSGPETSAIAITSGASIKGDVGEEVSEVYREALESSNVQNFEEAIEDQKSFLPVPVDPIQTAVAPVSTEIKEKEDPMAQWKELQEKRLRRQNEENQRRRMMEIQNQRALAALPKNEAQDDARRKAMQGLMKAMMGQMASVAKRHEYTSPKAVSVTDEEGYLQQIQLEREAAFAGSGYGEGGMGGMPSDMMAMEDEMPIIEPGTIVYAQTLLEANSDIPAPIMAHVLTGHFAGSRIIGDFTVEEEHLVLTFHTVVKDGISYTVNGYAVDPETNLPALATEVDRRYFKRMILPAATAFISGVAEAVTETGSTSIVGTDGETITTEEEDLDLNEELLKGVSEATDVITEILEEEGQDTEVLVRVEAGTPIGIMFIEPVYESTSRMGAPMAGGAGAGGPSSFLPPEQNNSSPARRPSISPAGFSPTDLQLVPSL